MITVIDYGMGNIGSILNVLKRLDVPAEAATSAEEIRLAEKLILPGVGSFDKGMMNLKSRDLISALNERVLDNKIPILGICLGMQLFSNRSEEGKVEGLGWIDAETIKFQTNKFEKPRKIPHMGWNSIVPKNNNSILENIDGNNRFYFVHSYHISNIDEQNVIGTTAYGYVFPSVIRKENIIGIQCHPERSHRNGITVLNNFVRM